MLCLRAVQVGLGFGVWHSQRSNGNSPFSSAKPEPQSPKFALPLPVGVFPMGFQARRAVLSIDHRNPQ